jgi:hypothetical protein
MDENFLTLLHKHLSLLKVAHTFSRQKLDTTTVLLTKLGINPSGPAMSALVDAGAMGGLSLVCRNLPGVRRSFLTACRVHTPR